MVGDEIGPIASDCLRRSYAGKSGDVGIFDNLQVYMRWCVCVCARVSLLHLSSRDFPLALGTQLRQNQLTAILSHFPTCETTSDLQCQLRIFFEGSIATSQHEAVTSKYQLQVRDCA